MNTASNSIIPPQPVGFIHFHGLTLLAVSHNGKQYVAARPICELIGIDWKTQKNVLEDDYGQEMYGTCWLISPKSRFLSRALILNEFRPTAIPLQHSG